MLNALLRWVSVCCLVAVPIVIPFIVSATMFFPYITGKNFTFRILTEIALAAWVVLAVREPKYRPRFSWVLAAFTLFVVIVGVADLTGANPFKSFWSNFERMEGYVALLHLFAYFLVASTMLATERLWQVYWYSSLAASVAVALIGLKPMLAALPVLTFPRLEAAFGNPIYLAVYSLFHIFIALILMVRWHGARWHQYLMGVIAFLHFLTMVLTQTRGTVLGFLGGAVLVAILVAFFERERPRMRQVAAGALLVLAVVAGAGFAIRNTEFARTTSLVARFTQIRLSEGTVNARFMNWGMAWEGVKERPLLGWGQDNYEYVFSKYFDPNMYGQEPWFDRTHDLIFDWLIAAGFLGLAAYLAVQVALLVHLWVLDPHERQWSLKTFTSFSAIRTLVKKHDDAFPATERALWTGLIAAYFFHNLFVFDNIVSYILFVSVLAYLHWRVTEGHEPLLATKRVHDDVSFSVVFPIVVVVFGGVLWYVNVPGIKTAQAIIEALVPQRMLPDGSVAQRTPAEMLESYRSALAYDKLGRQEVREQLAQAAANMQRSQQADNETKKAFMELATTEMQRELERNPGSARLWLFMGSLESSAGAFSEAEHAFETAVSLTPTKQIALFQLAEIKLVLGKTDEALALFKKAYEEVPAYDEASKLYALALIRSGKDKEAVDLLTEHFGTPAVDDSRLFMEWSNAKRYDIAAMILEARVAANPGDVQQTVSLAAAYKQLGRKDEAVRLLEGIRAAHPEYTDQMNNFIKDVRGGR